MFTVDDGDRLVIWLIWLLLAIYHVIERLGLSPRLAILTAEKAHRIMCGYRAGNSVSNRKGRSISLVFIEFQ